ncbi:MAG: nicotinate-nucleotide adenylyltransferase [Prolixibacteraceae bacterium]|jgi:nicotinate-nucleotide adenylyltransferase|nr:nicotinate-nucleotide adenylyltransferase [Prolixibacteraceae bacterium]MBT6004960.1 nicotinate-nucleotide adenylyltransferase [Prolixibacteraceae bacterium]MBT6765211.1 nicotinate-nucleotide adenylyltransferase [Prolixibacteraceae bacterium]MBT6998646.1 nicotinate-nucleotide adenylyltransferase [Prolixibacteraceae bacterium]MBT7397447.1 nicotinate-nucleotide adenylyltransferase [Prolixibacteraceae bacterium]
MSNPITDILTPKTYPRQKVGLYFGSFNPIHIGHMAIANYMVEFTEINQLWFVVSPQNPHKRKVNLLDDYQRLEIVQRAVEGDERLSASNFEFYLPKPSYTIDTLAYIKERHPKNDFVILMGSDNLESFHKWKNYEIIVENYGVIVYPRPGFDKSKIRMHKNITIVEKAPLMEISSSFIRKAIQQEKDVRHFLPPKSWKYIEEMNFYKK